MTDFVGRSTQLAILDDAYRAARSGEGAFVWMRGRRRVGKSRLVEEFLHRTRAAHVFFQAPRGRERDPLTEFARAAAESTLASAATFANVTPGNWRGALELAATGATFDAPAVIVIDEFPYLHEADDGIDADFQHTWDRALERIPVVLVCIGSDLSMMERLLEPDRPLHGRPTLEMTVPELHPDEVADLTGLDAVDALDAFLVVGGFPAVARTWRGGARVMTFLRKQLANSSTPLVTNGERILNAEFPTDANARTLLRVIGSGARTYSGAKSDSQLPGDTFDRSLATLLDKRVVTKAYPTSNPRRNDPRYSVTDAYLRFWLRFVGPYVDEIDRGRSDLVLARIERDWVMFRGTSIEPVIRDAVSRLLASEQYGGAVDVGSYWTRKHDVEIDLVGTDSLARPKRIGFTGSIKWRERSQFDGRDAAALIAHRAQLPGASDDTLLVGVSRAGFSTDILDVQLGPGDIVDAFRP